MANIAPFHKYVEVFQADKSTAKLTLSVRRCLQLSISATQSVARVRLRQPRRVELYGCAKDARRRLRRGSMLK